MVLGLAFAGSPSRLANGVRIAGRRRGREDASSGALDSRAPRGRARLRPGDLPGRSRTWQLQPRHLGIRVDWGAAVDAVRRQGNGFGPLRGFRRLDLRFFGADVAPPTQVYDGALEAKLNQISAAVNVRAPRGVDRAARAPARDRPEPHRPRARPPRCRGHDRPRAREPQTRARRAADPGRPTESHRKRSQGRAGAGAHRAVGPCPSDARRDALEPAAAAHCPRASASGRRAARPPDRRCGSQQLVHRPREARRQAAGGRRLGGQQERHSRDPGSVRPRARRAAERKGGTEEPRSSTEPELRSPT